MSSIEVLPGALASQIAAGEVVERPSSALKELLENALDAGATRIEVAVEAGGVGLISVLDNGRGMSREDARLSVERHATSKLRALSDLEALSSYGFRGEALPSIASVSRFTMRTRTADSPVGTELRVEGGAPPLLQNVGCAVGTLVEVRDLFFNVPARRKFLRSTGTEAGHLVECVETTALACPQLTLTLHRDGRRVRQWLRAASRQERIAEWSGAEPWVHCLGQRGPLKLEAFLSRPERARTGTAALRVFVNDRPIRDRSLAVAVAQSFGSVLERGRYPRGVLYLELPPHLVDFNVHPQKTELRFSEPRAVTGAVMALLKTEVGRALSALPSTTHALRDVQEPSSAHALEAEHRAPSRSAGAQHRDAHFSPQAAVVAPEPGSDGEMHRSPDGADRSIHRQTSVGRSTAPISPPVWRPHTPPPREARQLPMAAAPDSTSVDPPSIVARSYHGLRFVAQVRRMFLICESDEALVVLDQHAAAERVSYERLRAQADELPSQALLFPQRLKLDAGQLEVLSAERKRLATLGFELRERGGEFELLGVPQFAARASPEQLLEDVLAELAREGRAFSQRLDLALATLACHGSLRAGDPVSREEAQALLAALAESSFAGHCPHGRPIVSVTPWAELERGVGRR